MRVKKIILLICAMLCCFTLSFAQVQNEKGSVVLKNGMVMHGSITYLYDQPLNVIIHDSTGVNSTISPEQLKTINLDNGKRFISKTLIGKQDSSVLIFQTLIESPKISLFVREENDNKQFYVLKDNVIYDLVNNGQIIKTNDGTYKSYDKKYIGILKILMADQPDIIKKLDKIKLYEDEVVEVITEYNKGELTYFWQSNNKIKRGSYWVIFGQYSNYGSYLGGVQTINYCYGVVGGLQYYFTRSSRHSLKFALDYSNYNLAKYNSLTGEYSLDNFKAYSFGCRYEYDFLKANKYSIYLMLHIADISYYIETNPQSMGLIFYPRLNPGLGFELKPIKHIAFYAELNNILQINYIPNSFSAGLKYDLCKTNW